MNRKRFVITVGDARVGKSTISRLLLELYLKNKMNPRVFYHGHRNKLSMYQNKGFDINHLGFSRGDSDRLLLDLEMLPNIEVVLTDMPGQNLSELKFFDKDVSLIENLNCLGYRVTRCTIRDHGVFRSHCMVQCHQNKAILDELEKSAKKIGETCGIEEQTTV